MSQRSPGRSFRVGSWQVEPLRLVIRDRSGQEQVLTQRAMSVLVALADADGEVVRKYDLMEKVWGAAEVGDGALSQTIFEIRRALGDDTQHPEFIETIRGVGFRLIPAVVRDEHSGRGGPQPHWLVRNWTGRLVALVIAIVVVLLAYRMQPLNPETPKASTVVVLPFTHVGEPTDDIFVAESLSDALRDQLGQVPGLRIAARLSSLAVVQRQLDAKTTAETLGVSYLVDGRVRKNGRQWSVSVQLVDGHSGLELWSKTYERGEGGLLSIQVEISEEVATTIVPGADLGAMRPATLVASAHELMLLAREHEIRVRERPIVDKDRLRRAVALYRQATQQDPGSALAFSRLGRTLLYLGDVKGAETHVFRAISLDPNLSEVQNTLGRYYWAVGNPKSLQAFENAVELDPRNADALLDYAHDLWMGRTDHSLDPRVEALYRAAIEVDPLALSRYAALGDYLGKAGRKKEVESLMQTIREEFDSIESFRLLSWLNELIGRPDVAIAWALRAKNLEPDNPDIDGELAELFAILGDFDTAQEFEPDPGIGLLFRMRRYPELIRLAESVLELEPDNLDVRALLAFAYLTEDSPEAALQVLERSEVLESVGAHHAARSAREVEAYFIYITALAALDRKGATVNDEWRRMARSEEARFGWGDRSWISLFKGCMNALLEDKEAALEDFAVMQREAVRLPVDAYMRDFWCLKSLLDEPGYVDVLSYYDGVRKELREGLPSILEEHNISY